MGKRKPKFRVGQVVVPTGTGGQPAHIHFYDGVFYRIEGSVLHWREDELRALTARERGERKHHGG
jgi:mannose-6-phosphate isomerase-like protein (cupin superfamily)